jgi:hypothetical protein
MRPDEFVFALLSFMALSLPFVLVGFSRYLRYRETIALAQHGLLREDRGPARRPRGDAQRWGIIITALGAALSCGLYPIGFIAGDAFPLGYGPWMLVGFLPLAFGIALLLIHRVSQDELDDDELAAYDELPTGGPYGVGMDRVIGHREADFKAVALDDAVASDDEAADRKPEA